MSLNVLWLQSGDCGGCSMSLLCADTPDLPGAPEAAGVNLLWHPSLSQAGGAELVDPLERCADGRQPLDVLCPEGAVLRGPRGSGRFDRLAGTDQPMVHWVARLAAAARHVVAIGTCAAYGGIAAAGDSPTEACGLQYDDDRPGGLPGPHFRGTGGLPVVNVAGCSTHPGWVLDTLMALAEDTLAASDLDPLARPRFYADHLVHPGCARNEYYEVKASAQSPSQRGRLMEHLGCKGTQAHADCNLRLWNDTGSCTRGGHACFSCTEPGFQDPGHPFHQTPKVAGIPIGLPTDMPKAWFVALASLSKSATPQRVKDNAEADHLVVAPPVRRTRLR
jgi:ferredoxin hydrogenase small subunit